MAGASSQGELDWGFSQVFGERTPGRRFRMVRADVIVSSRAQMRWLLRHALGDARAPRERARSPETLATRAARVSRTGRRRRDATLAFPATTPRAAAARPLERATSLFPSPQPPTADRSKR